MLINFKNLLLLISSLCVIFFFFIGCQDRDKETEYVTISKKIVPDGTTDKIERPEFISMSESNEYYGQETLPKVDTISRDDLLEVLDVNLDFDRSDEQIVVIKEKAEPFSPIEIVVIDFDGVKNSYEISWREETQATNIRNFTIALEDIVGDHNLELICFGNDESNSRTLDVYRKTHAPSGVGLFYKSICSITSNGTIEIAKQDRAQAYKLGQKNGISFPIVSYSQDPDSENILDLIKREYYWKYQDQQYVLGKEEKIPGKKIEEKKLETLFTQPVKAYEDFLDGLWFKTEVEEEKGMEIISFDREKRRITFFENDVQEVYFWKSSHKTRIPNSFYLSGQNESVPFIEKVISIHVSSLDSIRVFVQDNDFKKSNFSWDGSYSKLPDDFVHSLVDPPSTKKKITGSDLYGTFTGDEQNEITFNFPYFHSRKGNEIKQGGYSIYTVDDVTILELKFFKENGLVDYSERYRIIYEREINDDTILHHCILIPGKITVKGFTSFDEPDIRLEQVEIVEDRDEEKSNQ